MNDGSRFPLAEELAGCELFAGFSEDTLGTLSAEIEIVPVRAGQVLFRQGDQPDGLYIVLRGRLRALLEDSGRVLGDIGRGGYVGEMALLTGAPRSATVLAVRDSQLARLSSAGFERLVATCPSSAIALARTMATRSQQNIRRALDSEGFSTLCILTNAGDQGGEQFATAFLDELRTFDRTEEVRLQSVLSTQAHDIDESWTDAGWFEALESHARFVVYRCCPAQPNWTQSCLRRSDLVLAVGDSGRLSALVQAIAPWRSDAVAHLDAVLLHPSEVVPGAADTLRRTQPMRHLLHARSGSRADAARAARLLTGRSIGLALSGGGRRGAAHVGTMRALQEAGIAVDLVSGTSAGAIVGGMIALEQDWRVAREHVHRLGRMRAWADLGPPVVSMLSGVTMRAVLQGCFGTARLEDTPLPFLPVCAAVDTGTVVIPDAGPLWLAVRASASLPGVFAPVPWQGRLLMDGALLNNLPADLVRARCPRGSVIASDVGMPSVRATYPEDLHSMSGWRLLAGAWSRRAGEPRQPGFIELLVNAACAASTAHLGEVRRFVDCYIAPPVDDHATLARRGGHDIDVLMTRAYEAAREELEAWAAQGDAN